MPRETVFDESYNVREVLDDVIERVALREKLLGTAKQFAEKRKEERFTLAIRQFERERGEVYSCDSPVREPDG